MNTLSKALTTAAAALAIGIPTATAAQATAAQATAAPAAPATAAAAASCSTSGLGDPSTCAQAVTWAKNHLGTTNSNYTGLCDHYVAVAYGWSNSGSATAAAHWSQMPAKYKHAGSRSVPAGGLAFFRGGSSGAGHVMISLGGGNFGSTDVGSNGRYSPGHYNKTTIATIESSFGETYLGWTQPWFNH